MTRFQVTVKVEGKADHTVVVQAADEWKARTAAMMRYPHRLNGATVSYEVERPMTPVTLTIDDDETIATTLESFVSDNEIESGEEAEIRAALKVGETYYGGGGAAPEWSIRL